MLKYITTKELKKKSEKVEINIVLIETKYPIVTILKKIYDSFYTLLMRDDPNKLIGFIENYKDSKIKEFVEGIEKDIAPDQEHSIPSVQFCIC